MAVVATDDFNRADANPIGGNWVTITGWNALQIVSNTARRTSGNSGARYNASFLNDQYAQAKIASISTDNGVLVRCASAAATFYTWSFYGGGEVWKNVSGTWTKLADRDATFNIGDVMRIEVSGTAISVYVNGSKIGANVTDTSIASGQAGLAIESDCSWDDFE
jgi:hypothetical protein